MISINTQTKILLMYKQNYILQILMFIIAYMFSEAKQSDSLDKLSNTLTEMSNSMLETKEKSKEEKELMFLKIDVAVKELDIINDLINKECGESETTTTVDCGCGFPKFLGSFGPFSIGIKYSAVKAKRRIIDEKLAAVESYVKNLQIGSFDETRMIKDTADHSDLYNEDNSKANKISDDDIEHTNKNEHVQVKKTVKEEKHAQQYEESKTMELDEVNNIEKSLGKKDNNIDESKTNKNISIGTNNPKITKNSGDNGTVKRLIENKIFDQSDKDKTKKI